MLLYYGDNVIQIRTYKGYAYRYIIHVGIATLVTFEYIIYTNISSSAKRYERPKKGRIQ